MRLLVVSLFACFASLVVAQSRDQYRVYGLPGLNFRPNFEQYAGYITVDEKSNRNLFFWFVTSQGNAASDPLVLWQNGGPGCSSVGGGLMSELGPFFPNETGTGLDQNPYAWNQYANVLYVESPAGVGFSYSDNSSDYTTVGDLRTAADLYVLITKFLQVFTEFQQTPFWLAGESYGGHYVPNLAKYIVEQNRKGGSQVNLKGFLVGNAWTVAEVDNFGAAYYWYTHALVSEDAFNGITKQCNLSNIGPLALETLAASVVRSGDVGNMTCEDYQNLAFKQMGNINIYDVYVDVCESSEGGSRRGLRSDIQQFMKQLGHHHRRPDAVSSGSHRSKLRGSGDNPAGGASQYDPCIDREVSHYLNQKEVQQAIHARSDLPYPWSMCSSVVKYSRKDLLSSMLPVYEFLFDADIKILVYSGDVDAIVPVTGTRAWIKKLGLDVVEPWRPYVVDNQVGGYTVKYDNMTFATVRNAGHMVPYTQPGRALHMFRSWIYQQPL